MEVRRAAALTLTTCALAWPARADTESIALEYRAASGCPERERFIQEVRALTTKAELVEGDESLRRFRVESERKGNGVTGRLTIVKDGKSSEREVSGKTCEEVVSALALATAIAVDPSVLGGEPVEVEAEPKPVEPEKKPEPPPPPPKPEVDRGKQPPRAPPPTRRANQAVLSLGGGAMSGITPAKFAIRPALRGGFRPGFELAPEFFLEVAGIIPVDEPEATFSALLARMGITWEFLEAGNMAFGIVAGGELGVLRAVGGDDIRQPLTEERPWASADLGLSLRVPAESMFFVRAEVGPFVTFTRHEYVITSTANEATDVHTIPAFGGRVSGFVGFFL